MAVGSTIEGYRVTELLQGGEWNVYRSQSATGARALVTIVQPPPPPPVLEALALPFTGIPKLIASVPVDNGLALIEAEPGGWRISDLRWPLPVDEVIRIGLDIARTLERIHAAGCIHGSLRPQTTWIDQSSHLTGTTPRPELVGLHVLANTTRTGVYSPFLDDIFYPDILARNEPRSAASDVAQLGMLLHHMATHASPFRRPDDIMFQPLVRALEGDAPPWQSDDPRSRALEALARDAFDPKQVATRSLAPLLAGLERLAQRA
jgi:serine/threonine protein kinase